LPAIELRDLAKTYAIPVKQPGLSGSLRGLFRPTYREKVAVDGISLTVEPGEVVGYIGVNGAGKSTTIKMLTGILAPTSGSVRVLGRDPHRQRVENARDIGVVFGQRTQLWWDLALIESLNLIARIYEVEENRFKRLLGEFRETLELDEILRQPIRTMSLGQKMRAELAATLLHEPKVVYLDEPTIGLDVVVKDRIRDFIRLQNHERGTTVILTTHDLGDIEELCRRVVIIDAGRLIYDGPISTIRERFGQERVINFETAGRPGPMILPAGAEVTAVEDRRVELRFNRNLTSASQVASAVMSQVEVLDFNLKEPDLAGIIKRIYGGALNAPGPAGAAA
jgi:ABC-2 type transport system ATP-binding protein